MNASGNRGNGSNASKTTSSEPNIVANGSNLYRGGEKVTHSGSNSSNGAIIRRKSVEFDLALRNTITTDKINKSSAYCGGGSMINMMMMNMMAAAATTPGSSIGPIPQPRRSLMSASTTYDTQFYMQHTQAAAVAQAVAQQQVYQNHAQLQYQILQQQFAAQQLQQNLQQQQQQLAAVQQAQAAAASVTQQQQQQQQRRPRPLVRHLEPEHV